MSAHTPGPWRIGPNGEGDIEALVCGKWHEVAALIDNATEHDQRPIPTAYIRDANARLIAAAPDLLEALKEAEGKLTQMVHVFVASNFTDRYGDGPAMALIAATARAAIAKAEGR